MDTCNIVNSALYGALLLVCIALIIDCLRRVIPPTIAKFRVCVALFTLVGFIGALRGGSTDVVARVVPAILGYMFIRLSVLYLFENFLQVISALKLGLGEANRNLQWMLSCWTVAKPIIVVSYLTFAIAFPFDMTNRVTFAASCFGLASTVFAIFPMCITIIHLGYTVKLHRSTLAIDVDADGASPEQEEIDSRDAELKKVQWQLWVSGTVLLALCLYWITTSVSSLRANASDLGRELAGSVGCSIAPIIYSLILPMGIAHFLTRCPHAKPKTMSDVTSRTRVGSAGSGTSFENSPQSRRNLAPGGTGGNDSKIPTKSASSSSDDDGTNGNADEGTAGNATELTDLDLSV